MAVNNVGGSGLVLVTANVGSLFEFYDQLMASWLQSIKTIIEKRQPPMIMLHLQEMGGKRVDESIVHDIAMFFSQLRAFMLDLSYTHAMLYYDKDVSDEQQNAHYTALGVACFQRTCITANTGIEEDQSTQCPFNPYNFETNRFEPCPLNAVSENENNVQFVHKEKYPCSMCSGRSFRKGHVITRWQSNHNLKCCINLVNVHLFHDASNLVALELEPSIYAERRSFALRYTIDRTHELDRAVLDGTYTEWAMANTKHNQHTHTLTCATDTLMVNGNGINDHDGEDGKREHVSTLERLQHIHTPTFYFGDMNFRLALKSFLKSLESESVIPMERVVSYSNNGNGNGNSLSPVSASASPSWTEDTTFNHSLVLDSPAPVDDRTNASRQPSESATSPSADVSSWRGMLAPPDMMKKRTSSDSSDVGLMEQANQYDYIQHETGLLQLRLKRKMFDWRSDGSHDLTISNRYKWMLQFDRELQHSFHNQLFELPIHFMPSYPRTEPSTSPKDRGVQFMRSRAPAWCDRVVMNKAAWDNIQTDNCYYALLGDNTPTGDHKPVCLQIDHFATNPE